MAEAAKKLDAEIKQITGKVTIVLADKKREPMATRFRFMIDITDEDGVLTRAEISEIMNDAFSAAKLAVPQSKKQTVKVVWPQEVPNYHVHRGEECTACYEAADDELGMD